MRALYRKDPANLNEDLKDDQLKMFLPEYSLEVLPVFGQLSFPHLVYTTPPVTPHVTPLGSGGPCGPSLPCLPGKRPKSNRSKL